MKKMLPWIALALCGLLLAALVFGVLTFLKFTNQSGTSAQGSQSVEDYFADSWQGFTLTNYDSQTQTVCLQKSLEVTYDGACSYGKECYEDLALGHIDTMQVMISGCSASCGVSLNKIEISALSTDGLTIYTVSSDGTLAACWEN